MQHRVKAPAAAAWLCAVGAIFALTLFAGCGDDDDSAKTPTAAAAVATSPASTVATSPTAAPATAPPATATTSTGSALDGTWTGTWNSSDTSDNGAVTIQWKQSGQQLAGTIVVSNTPCVTNGTITGTVSGTTITFGAVQGATTIAYTGTLSGTSLSGTYQANASCGNAKGRWSATKGS